MQLVPNSWGSASLLEFNPCHTPAGSAAGGQFCSTASSGFTEGFAPEAATSLTQLQDVLTDLSFHQPDQPAREHMGAMDLDTGQPVGDLLAGTEDEVVIPTAAQDVWAAHPGQLLTAHTHPESSAFSYEDFYFHNAFNTKAALPYAPERTPFLPKVDRIHVYGEDGSWYELTFPKIYNQNEVAEIRASFSKLHDRSVEQARLRTDQWATAQDWWQNPNKPPKTWALMNDREHIRYVAEKAGQLDALADTHAEHFKQEAVHIWETLAPHYGLGFRYHLAPPKVAGERSH